MDILKALLELLSTRAPYFALPVGLLLMVASLVPFRFQRAGWVLRNPTAWTSRLALGLVGALVFALGLFGAFKVDSVAIEKLATKRLASYFSYITISGAESDCESGKCLLTFRDSTLVLAPKGTEASYEGRVKTGGRITSFSTIPRAEILNPEQFPANPTLAEFRIRPARSSDTQLQAQGEAVIETKFSAAAGKVGPHLPYSTDYVVVVVDMRAMQFSLRSQIVPKIETRREDGTQISGYVTPTMNVFEGGKVVVLTAREVAAGSSVYITWGQLQ